MERIVIGGTFSGLHDGHRKFLRKAFSLEGRVFIGLTSDGMAGKKSVPGKIPPYAERKKSLEDFLRSEGFLKRALIMKIDDPFSGGLAPGLTRIVVSRETKKNAERINEMRKEQGLKPLVIVEVSWALAKDGRPISDARIRKGEISKDGCVNSRCRGV